MPERDAWLHCRRSRPGVVPSHRAPATFDGHRPDTISPLTNSLSHPEVFVIDVPTHHVCQHYSDCPIAQSFLLLCPSISVQARLQTVGSDCATGRRASQPAIPPSKLPNGFNECDDQRPKEELQWWVDCSGARNCCIDKVHSYQHECTAGPKIKDSDYLEVATYTYVAGFCCKKSK